MGFHNNTNTWGIFPSFSGVTNTPAMAITFDGKIGIGTASPLEKLDVYGTSRISSAYPRLDFFCTTGQSTNAWGNSTGAAGDYRIIQTVMHRMQPKDLLILITDRIPRTRPECV